MSNEVVVRENAFQPPAAVQQYGIENAASSVAAQAKAMVEARYVMAMQRPRNWDTVRRSVLDECLRPSFANNKSAYYNKPIGKGVEGLGIRFVEVALRCMTNVLIETTMIFEDGAKELHRVSVTDLESNITYPMDVKVSKTVERAKPSDDGSFISMRTNTYGKAVYTVLANDDDLLNKRAALISKAIRTLGLRLIPGDVCDEAEAIIKKIRLDGAAKDPGAERKAIVDAFNGIGVKASQLAEYLGHDIGSCSPHELVQLRGLYGAIRDGEATWSSVMDNKEENNPVPPKVKVSEILAGTPVEKPKRAAKPAQNYVILPPTPELDDEPTPEELREADAPFVQAGMTLPLADSGQFRAERAGWTETKNNAYINEKQRLLGIGYSHEDAHEDAYKAATK